MAAMTVSTRDRIHVSVTPQVKRIVNRHALPGEPRAATLVRLATLGHEALEDNDLIVFPGPGRPITLEDVKAVEDYDVEDAIRLLHGE